MILFGKKKKSSGSSGESCLAAEQWPCSSSEGVGVKCGYRDTSLAAEPLVHTGFSADGFVRPGGFPWLLPRDFCSLRPCHTPLPSAFSLAELLSKALQVPSCCFPFLAPSPGAEQFGAGRGAEQGISELRFGAPSLLCSLLSLSKSIRRG